MSVKSIPWRKCPSLGIRIGKMEVGQLLTSAKWDILSEISLKPSSPLELSNKLGTTMANISQQIRLLEAMGLVSKKRVPNRDRGKPRMLFSLRHDFGYVVACMGGYAERKLVELEDYHRFVLRSWCSFPTQAHSLLEQVYWKLEPFLDQIDSIAGEMKDDVVSIQVISTVEAVKKKIPTLSISWKNHSVNFKLVGKHSDNMIVLFGSSDTGLKENV